MKFSERLLKQYLSHVYWICGGPCGGKSTMTELLSAKWGMTPYHSDDLNSVYKSKANPQDHPAILRYFVSWEWYFLDKENNRKEWLLAAEEETLEFVLLDLLQMGSAVPVVVDTFIAPAFLKRIADPQRIIYLFAEEALIRKDYLDRDHLRGMEDLFPSLSDPHAARQGVLDGAVDISNHYLRHAKAQVLPYFIRNASVTPSDMLNHLEQHFQLN